jgi:medium-chain acyl-[acyl-carrier-protein] hydrolase
MAPWVVHREVEPRARVRLFCLPYAGGGASIYRKWGAETPAELGVCPVELPGRETRFTEARFTRLEALIPAIVSGLESWFDRPFALFGHSLGALVAFEIARFLRARGGPRPIHLFASAHRAPHLQRSDPPMSGLSDAEFVARLRELGGTPDAVLDNPELLDLVVPVLRDDFALAERHTHEAGAPLDCPLTVFGGLADEHVGKEELDPWREHTRGAFRLCMLPGGHFFLQQARAAMLAEIGRDLRAFVRPT